MTNIIKEDKSVNAENFAFLLAQSNYNLSTVFRSKNKNECVADTPMTSEDKTLSVGYTVAQLEESKSRNNQYQFKLLSASTNQLTDLKDADINVLASIFTADNTENPANLSDLTMGNVPRLGNQALLSLFSSIELYIDSTLIERIDYPGMSANVDYALRYPHTEVAEKCLESNGFIRPLEDAYVYSSGLKTDGVYRFKNDSVSWGVVSPTTGKNYLRGIVQQRIRLRDIFPCIDTLPPIFNHSVTVNFTRKSSNDIIASNSGFATTVSEATVYHIPYTHLCAFIDFKLSVDCHIITDELRKAAMEYYSKPIETIFTKCKQIPTGFVSQPKGNSAMSFNVSVDSAYKNKLAVLAIPRTTLFSNQPHSNTTQNTAEQYSDDLGFTYDIAQAPANSYTHGGLRSLTVYTMNGVKLQSFDMSRDGEFKGPIDVYSKMCMLDTKQSNGADQKISNYQCVYQEYLKAREHFGQIAEEGLDFITFIKEYCIFCVDLSSFTIGAGENLRIEMVFDDWAGHYNPYYSNNDDTKEYLSRQLFTFFYSDKILRLLPNQNVELADLFQARTESDETNEI